MCNFFDILSLNGIDSSLFNMCLSKKANNESTQSFNPVNLKIRITKMLFSLIVISSIFNYGCSKEDMSIKTGEPVNVEPIS